MVIIMDYAQKAKDLFLSGCNCSQAVFAAFADVVGLTETAAKKVSVGLGGGVGRMREVCGAVSGGAMVLGFVFGGENGENKAEAYKQVQKFAESFKAYNYSVICRDLLGLNKNTRETFKPDERTKEYYKARPCAELVYDAARIVQEMIS